MKALSLWQPWASLWLTNAKIHETRHWPTRHRGPLLVHAAKRPIDECDGDELDRICIRLFGAGYRTEMPRGALLGIVHVVACVPPAQVGIGSLPPGAPYDRAEHDDDRACGDWSEGRFAWRRGAYSSFAPIPYVGHQGLFTVPDSNLAAQSAHYPRTIP